MPPNIVLNPHCAPCVFLSPLCGRRISVFWSTHDSHNAATRVKAFASRFRVDNASTCLQLASTYPPVTVRLNLHLRHLGVKKSRFLRIVRVLAHSHFAQNDGVGICTCKTPDKARNHPICVILTEHAAAPLRHPEIAQQSKDLAFPE